MAVKTIVVDNGYAASSFGGSLPVDGDSIVIPAGLTLTMNSANTSLISSISGAGTLIIPTTAGSYKLNCSGNISVTRITGGTREVPIPPTVNFEFQLTTTAGRFTKANAVEVYGYVPPTQKWYAEIKTQAAAGATSVIVKGNFSEWQNLISGLSGKRACKVWITKYSLQSAGTPANDWYTITNAVYDAGNDQTVLTVSALAEMKETGSYVTFETRNILAQSNTSAQINGGIGNIMDSWEIRCLSGGYCSSVTYAYLDNCSFCGTGGGLYGGVAGSYNNIVSTLGGSVFTGSLSLVFNNLFVTGSSQPTRYGANLKFKDSVFTGNYSSQYNSSLYFKDCLISANAGFIGFNNDLYIDHCVVKDNGSGILSSSGVAKNCIFANNGIDISVSPDFKTYNCQLNSYTQVSFSSIKGGSSSVNTKWLVQAFDIGQVQDARKDWTLGGYTMFDPAQSVGLHPIFGKTAQIILTDSAYLTFTEEEYTLKAGVNYRWTWVVLKDINEMYITPNIAIIDPINDPIYGGVPLVIREMVDDTNWQLIVTEYKPVKDMQVLVRVSCCHVGHTVYSKVFLQPSEERYHL